MELHQVTRQSVSDQVIAQMKENIENGIWKPGERLPGETQLGESLGVSRVTVRNALQKLAGEGLIETRVGDGSYVRRLSISEAMSRVNIPGALTEKELRELLEFRCVMEGPLCGLAATHITERGIAQLRQIYQEMCSVGQDETAFAAADVKFHTTLVSFCGNDILIAAYQMICVNFSKAMPEIVHRRGNASGLRFHKRILGAIETRDATAARAIMEEHMKEMVQELL